MVEEVVDFGAGHDVIFLRDLVKTLAIGGALYYRFLLSGTVHRDVCVPGE
jgi:hypothetical protein